MQIFGPGLRILQNSQPGGMAEAANQIAAALEARRENAAPMQETGNILLPLQAPLRCVSEDKSYCLVLAYLGRKKANGNALPAWVAFIETLLTNC